jgi:small conductance mechanosensitive channel
MDFEEILAKITLWFFKSGIKILLILFLAFVLNRFFQILLKRVIIKKIRDGIKEEIKKKRIGTLVSALGGTLRFIIWIIAVLIILPEFGVEITPILASLGIAGLALGMAAKDTVSDSISGFFIILEGQIFVGDKVKIGGIEGEVVDFNLRRTVIKDEEGFLHFIPISQIKIVSKKIK